MKLNFDPLPITELYSICQQCEKTVGIKPVDNKIRPTVTLMKALSGVLKSAFDLDTLPTIAQTWQIWQWTYDQYEVTRKRHELACDLTAAYSVNAFDLSEDRQAGMLANLPRVRAQDRLNRGDFAPTDYRGVYSLVLLATGDEDQARKARADAVEASMDSQKS